MKNYEAKEITKTEDVLISVVCDRCKKQIKMHQFISENDCLEGGEITLDAGYGSVHDDSYQKFDICDNCISEVLKQFSNENV